MMRTDLVTTPAEAVPPVHPLDEVLPAARLTALGLPKDQVALLVNADLLAAGIVTLIQSLGFRKFGAAVGPMRAIAPPADPAPRRTGLRPAHQGRTAAGASAR